MRWDPQVTKSFVTNDMEEKCDMDKLGGQKARTKKYL
jgi:hypothetical protein